MTDGTPWSAVDLVTVLLTVVTIVLAALGIFIAMAAILGYQALSDQSRKQAQETSASQVGDFLRSEAFAEQLRAIVSEQTKNYDRDEALATLNARSRVDRRGDPPDQPDTEWKEE